jgi:hypothetical protein
MRGMNKDVRSYILQLIHPVCFSAYQLFQVRIYNSQVIPEYLFISAHHSH